MCKMATPSDESGSQQQDAPVWLADHINAVGNEVMQGDDDHVKESVTSVDAVMNIDKNCEIKGSAINTEEPIDSFLSNGWSDLRYVDVNIDSISGIFMV